MLQLLYLRFEKPRFDREVYESIQNRNRAALQFMKNSPQSIMQDSMSLIMSDYHPRTLLYNEAYLDRMDLAEMERIYRERIKDASDFTFFIGRQYRCRNRETACGEVHRLAQIGLPEGDVARNGVRSPKGKTVKVMNWTLKRRKRR